MKYKFPKSVSCFITIGLTYLLFMTIAWAFGYKGQPENFKFMFPVPFVAILTYCILLVSLWNKTK